MSEFIAVSSDFIPTERPDAEPMLYNTTMTPLLDPRVVVIIITPELSRRIKSTSR